IRERAYYIRYARTPPQAASTADQNDAEKLFLPAPLRLPGKKNADLPFCLTHAADCDLHVSFAPETLEFFAPFDKQDTASLNQIIQSQGKQLAVSIDPVKVDVK